jgi:hypothetical protein
MPAIAVPKNASRALPGTHRVGRLERRHAGCPEAAPGGNIARGERPSMSNVIAASFSDASAARAAAERLVQGGFAAARVHVHEKGQRPRNAEGIELDEALSGGFFSNMLGLLDGLFDAPKRPNEARTFDEVVRRESAGLTVMVENDAEAQRARSLLEAAGAFGLDRHPVEDNDGGELRPTAGER